MCTFMEFNYGTQIYELNVMKSWIKEVKTRQRYISPTKYCRQYFILYNFYAFVYYPLSLRVFLF